MNRAKKIMLQRIVEKHRLGALIFWRPDELVMLLGYLPQWGLSFLVYTSVREPVLYVPALEPEDILPAGIAVETYPLGMPDCEDPWQELYKKIKEQLTIAAARYKPVSFIKYIGGTTPCRMSAEQPPLPATLLDSLSMLSRVGYMDISMDLMQLYQHKTAEDAEALRRTHKVAAKAVEQFFQSVKAGITEKEVANQVEAAVQLMTGINGIGFAKAWPMIQSGKNTCYSGMFNRTSGKTIEEGELVLIEMGICVDGYWADITRTTAVGTLSACRQKLFTVVTEAQEQALALLRPGVVMANVDAAARTHIAQAGWAHLYNHALGHQTGFRYHDPGPVLAPNSTAVLEEGMVFTVEPGAYGEEVGGGVRIEENVLITADGYELLSKYPKTLTGK